MAEEAELEAVSKDLEKRRFGTAVTPATKDSPGAKPLNESDRKKLERQVGGHVTRVPERGYLRNRLMRVAGAALALLTLHEATPKAGPTIQEAATNVKTGVSDTFGRVVQRAGGPEPIDVITQKARQELESARQKDREINPTPVPTLPPRELPPVQQPQVEPARGQDGTPIPGINPNKIKRT